MVRNRCELVDQIIDQLERTGSLCDPRDPQQKHVPAPDKEFRELMRTELVSVVEELGRPSPKWIAEQARENEQIFEAALSVRRVAVAFGPNELDPLIKQLESACTFRTATRADQEDAAARLRTVAKVRPKLANKLEQAAARLEASARLEPSSGSMAQPGMELKIAAAEAALKLILVFTAAKATKTKDGVFKTITALLVQSAVGGEHSVERACDAVLRARK